MKKAETIKEIYKIFAPEKFLNKKDEEFYVDLYLKHFVNDLQTFLSQDKVAMVKVN